MPISWVLVSYKNQTIAPHQRIPTYNFEGKIENTKNKY